MRVDCGLDVATKPRQLAPQLRTLIKITQPGTRTCHRQAHSDPQEKSNLASGACVLSDSPKTIPHPFCDEASGPVAF